MFIIFNALNKPHTFLVGRVVSNQCIQHLQNKANKIMEFALGHVCRKWQSLKQKPSTGNGMLPERTTKTTFSNLFIIIEVEGEIQTDKDISLICLSNELDNQCGVN